MARLARLPANDRGAETAASAGRAPRPRSQYYAFLSYSHQDEELANWLHEELEEFRVPPTLAGRLTANGVIPRRLTPIFRDQHELAAADDLGEEIREALECSQYLIVLCSPEAAKSHWTNAEIETFKRTRPDGCVLAAIASGEPFASDIAGREAEECFPPALRQKFDRRGRPTGKRAEPLAADLRDEQDRRLGVLKLVAGMLGVGLDDLVQRATTRRHRRLAWLAAASLAGMAVASGLAITAIQARDAARDQRREAEGLVAFMLGDLKDKLEPIGRLDALDGVGSRVLAYYSKQDTAQLSDAALLQRSRALSLTAEVANLRGDLNTAQQLYREAAAGTAEAVGRNPNDPQRLFDHAQNIYYFGDLATQRGDYKRAEGAFREYKRLADRMVAIEPNNLKWRMEVQYAETNLGIVLMKQRRFDEAASQLSGALLTMRAVAGVDPRNSDYQKSLGSALGWLADAELWSGRLNDAIAHREQLVGLLQRLSKQSNGDVAYRQKLIPAERSLGQLYAARGLTQQAEQHLRAALSVAAELIGEEPSNTRWLDYGAIARLTLAQYLITTGNSADARGEAAAGCALARQLLAHDRTVVLWQMDQLTCLNVGTQLALGSGQPQAALASAQEAAKLAITIKSGDPVADRYAVARSKALLGDVYARSGDRAAAAAQWRQALAALPPNVPERPWESEERARLLTRLGDPQGRAITAELAAKGIRNADVLKV